MKRRYLWACILAVGGGYINSKGESLFSKPVLFGVLGGLILGFLVGLLVEKRGRKSTTS
jgi:hypothetical protein